MTLAKGGVGKLVEEAAATASAGDLAILAAHESTRVRHAVAGNGAVTDATLLTLLSDEDELVRLSAADTAVPRHALEATLLGSADPWVRHELASHFSVGERELSREAQAALVRDPLRATREAMARRTDYRDLFELLLADEVPDVRALCATNPRAGRTDFDTLLRDRDRRARAMAVELGLLFPDDDHLLLVVKDRSALVRWAALYRLGVPGWFAERLVDDPTADVQIAARLAVEGKTWEPGAEAEARSEQDHLRLKATPDQWLSYETSRSDMSLDQVREQDISENS